MSLDIEEAVEIIRISSLEDALILNEDYDGKLSEGNCDKERLFILKRTAEARIKELT